MMSAKSASNAGGGDGEHSVSPHGVAGAGGGGGGSRVSHGGIGGAHSGQSAQRSGSPVAAPSDGPLGRVAPLPRLDRERN